MMQVVKTILVSFLTALSGCASVEPKQVIQLANKTMAVVSYVDNDLSLQKSGPMPFVDHQVGIQQREWGLRQRSETRIKELLESSRRSMSVRIVPAPADRGAQVHPDLLEGVDLLLVLQPGERQVYELATKGFGPMNGVGLKQVSRFLEPTKAMAFASYKAMVFSMPDGKLVAMALDTKYHELPGAVLAEGPVISPEGDWMAREAVNTQLDAVIQALLFKLGLTPSVGKH